MKTERDFVRGLLFYDDDDNDDDSTLDDDSPLLMMTPHLLKSSSYRLIAEFTWDKVSDASPEGGGGIMSPFYCAKAFCSCTISTVKTGV